MFQSCHFLFRISTLSNSNILKIMIKRKLTNAYLADFDLLTEALYLCWIKAFDVETNRLDSSLLKELIASSGL